MSDKTIKVCINGTGFAGDFTVRAYDQIPHKNAVNIERMAICSGSIENAEKFANTHGIPKAYTDHKEMVNAVKPDIDNIACANYVHGQYTKEAAEAGVKLIMLEKPPVIWPGYTENRDAPAETRKKEAMAYLASILDSVKDNGSKLLYAENFVYLDGIKGMVELLFEAIKTGKGKILHQHGVCAHQGSHAPAYDTPSKSGGGALFNKACHPLGPILYLKQVEGIIRDGKPIRPQKISAMALQVLKHQPEASGEHFRVMQNVDDFGRISIVFEDQTVAEVIGSDLSISGIRNELSIISDFGQYDIRSNPANANELFLPDANAAGNILLREKLPTPQGTSFPAPNQSHLHGYINEIEDAVNCVINDDQYPQSGPMMAWDMMAVIMAAYESSEKESVFVDISEYINEREFTQNDMPKPSDMGTVFQRI